jgi:hypothetical protein
MILKSFRYQKELPIQYDGINSNGQVLGFILGISVLLTKPFLFLIYRRNSLVRSNTELFVLVYGKNAVLLNFMESISATITCLHLNSNGVRHNSLIYLDIRNYLYNLSRSLNLDVYIKALSSRYYRENMLRVIKLDILREVFQFYLSHGTKHCLVLNDHTCYSVLLHDMAEKMGINTVYLQHASIGKGFPDLYFDVNILFSRASLDKYNNPLAKRVEIIYDLRLLKLTKCSVNRGGGNLLICLNAIDKKRNVIELVECIKENVTIRLHPSDSRDSMSRGWPDNCQVSNSTLEHDLLSSRLVIANETSLFVEAAYLGVPGVIASFFGDSRFSDDYGFEEEGLLPHFDNKEDLLNWLDRNIYNLDLDQWLFHLGDIHLGDNLKYIMDDIFN